MEQHKSSPCVVGSTVAFDSTVAVRTTFRISHTQTLKSHTAMSLTAITANQILDSRGNPTVRVLVKLSNGDRFEAQVPSGASKGSYEALELRDGDAAAYGGKGVLRAVYNVNEILGPAVLKSGLRPDQQSEIDNLLIAEDGTSDKSKLGANAILGISMAVARAGASVKGLHLYEHIGALAGALASAPYVLPVPFTNQLNGGVHSGNPLAMQEFMVCPVGASGMQHAMQIAAEVYHNLKTVITEDYGLAGTGVGDEGGFAPPIQTAKEALELLTKATSRAGHTGKVKFAIDPASSEFFRNGQYDLAFKTSNKNGEQSISADKLADMYEDLAREYPIALLEDPFAEDDWHSWTSFLERDIDSKGYQFEVVGDDLLATNVDRMKLAYEKKGGSCLCIAVMLSAPTDDNMHSIACNSLLLKINQIGSITESIAAAKKAYEYGWSVFVSHRSGETTDSFIADLVVGLRTGHIKSGAPCRGERVAKYNRLMEIEELLQGKGIYAGPDFRYIHQTKFSY